MSKRGNPSRGHWIAKKYAPRQRRTETQNIHTHIKRTPRAQLGHWENKKRCKKGVERSFSVFTRLHCVCVCVLGIWSKIRTVYSFTRGKVRARNLQAEFLWVARWVARVAECWCLVFITKPPRTVIMWLYKLCASCHESLFTLVDFAWKIHFAS